jgi:hypothetical protein
VQFVSPQPADYLNNPNYVFNNNSGDAAYSIIPTGNVQQTSAPNDTFVGADFAADFSDVPISTTPMLLTQLQVTGAGGSLAPQPGDTFAVTLQPVAGSMGATSFYDSDSNPVASNVDSAPVSDVITNVSEGTSAPEPSTLMGLLVSGGIGFCVLRGKRLVRQFGRKRSA